MWDRIRRIYEMLLRVMAFLNENNDVLKSIPVIVAAKAVIEIQVAALAALGVEKVSKTAASKVGTVQRGDARDLLTDAMEDVVDLWISMFDDVGSEAELIAMPVNRTDQNIIATARDIRNAAEPFAAEFIARDLPADFLADLTIKTDVFQAAVNEAESAKRARIGTNAAFEEPARIGKAQIKKIDPIIKRKFRSNPQKFTEWQVASHIERAPQSPPAAGNPPPTT